MFFPHDRHAEDWIRQAAARWTQEELDIIVALAEALAEQQGRKKLSVPELQRAELHYVHEGHRPHAHQAD